MKENKYYVSFCTDNHPIQDIGVCMESIFSNNPYNFEIFVLHSKKLEKEGLKKIAKKWNQKLTFIKVNPKVIKKLPIREWWPEEMYYRLLIPKYCPKYVNKILYLDTDTLVDKNIRELFETDISNYPVAARPAKEIEGLAEREDFLGIKRGSYFGSGIMLLNLKILRKNKFFEKIIYYGERNTEKLLAPDQDLLNIFFSNNYYKLKDTYHCALLKGYKSSCNPQDAKIIHFSGKYKPSSCLCLHPLRNRYLFYLEKTPWKGNYEKLTLMRFMKRNLLFMARLIKNSETFAKIKKIIK